MSKVVHEAGIVKEGQTLFRRQYNPDLGFESHSVSSFFDALEHFVSEAFFDLAKEFKMSRFHAFIEQAKIGDEVYVLYCIAESCCESKTVQRSLLRVAQKLEMKDWKAKLTMSNISQLRLEPILEDLIDEEFLAFNLSSGEKAKKRLARF